MEPELREDHPTSGPTAPKRSEPKPEQAAFTVPFASEGLESVRDSHC
jgi:hypothetical protein